MTDDDPIMLLSDCPVTMPETGAYVYPTTSTTCAPTIFNNDNIVWAFDDLIMLHPTTSTTCAPTSAPPRMFETDPNIASSWLETASDEAILQYLAHELLWDDDMLPELQEQPLSTDIQPLDSAQVAPLSSSNLVDHQHHHSELMMMENQHSPDNVPPALREYFALLQHIL